MDSVTSFSLFEAVPASSPIRSEAALAGSIEGREAGTLVSGKEASSLVCSDDDVPGIVACSAFVTWTPTVGKALGCRTDADGLRPNDATSDPGPDACGEVSAKGSAMDIGRSGKALKSKMGQGRDDGWELDAWLPRTMHKRILLFYPIYQKASSPNWSLPAWTPGTSTQRWRRTSSEESSIDGLNAADLAFPGPRDGGNPVPGSRTEAGSPPPHALRRRLLGQLHRNTNILQGMI